ncbi:TonB-dependent receptor [Elongatibacter sediminis]|uniref:TonB-dependent receptor n=1 Tax=Elongatibacter sediminis TaxID=3119006 RepID=A0AAW9RFZ1_9GAMM
MKKKLIPILLLPSLAWGAQESEISGPETLLEEVVVSGYRLSSPLETDTSITVLDAEAIERSSIQHFEELIPLVPNMNGSGEASRMRYLQLRGLGEREQYEGAPNPSVGFIIDDIDLSGVGTVGGLFDIGQVEVLRGPQSARYGSSALAGVVYMRSTRPSATPTLAAELNGGGDGMFSAGIAAGGALADGLNARIAVQHFEQDGFRDNAWLDRDDTNGRDELTARAKFDWAISDDWSALLTLMYLDFDNGYDAFTVRNDDLMHSDKPGEDRQETRAASLRLEGPLSGAVDFVSITSFADSDIRYGFDGDWGNDDFWGSYGNYIYDYSYVNPRQRDSLAQEFRLQSSSAGRLFGGTTDWVIGLHADRLEEDNAISSTGVYDDSGAENYCAPCLTDRQIQSRYQADTLALFGSLDARLAPAWTLSAGLRYERWKADYQDQWSDINYPGVPPEGNSCTQFDCRPDENLWGGHLALSYDLRDDLRAYARVARGFKSGGFNPSLAALQGVALLGPEFIPYEPEYLWNYELGLKGLFLGGRLAADFAVFTMDRRDAQLSQSSQQVAFDPNSFVFVTYNGDARVNGLETSLSWSLTDAWTLHGSLGLLDSEIRESEKTAAVSPNAIDRDLAHAPSWNLNLGASWTTDGGWFGRLDFNASDAFYFDISHNQKSSSYQVVNLRVGKAWGRWSVAAWGRNIFDENYATRGFYFGNEPPLFENTLYTRFGDPANYGVTVRYQF